jgi:hypothetical protein
MKAKKGDKVWVKQGGLPIKEFTVVSAGRKWITVGIGFRFHTETLHGEYGNRLYVSKLEYENKVEHSNLKHSIADRMTGYGKSPFSLDQLKRIDSILSEAQA